MATNINMPRLGLTMTEGVIIKWLKAEGDNVEKGEEIVEVESDKSTVAYEAPESGTLLKILVKEGDTCEIYKPIAILGEEGESLEGFGVEAGSADEPAEVSVAVTAAVKEEIVQEKEAAGSDGKRVFVSPSAKRVAKENNLDISLIPFPSGKKRIEKADVLSYLQRNKVKATPLAAKIAEEKGMDLTAISKGPSERIFSIDLETKQTRREGRENRFPVAGMRKVIAARMKSSLDTAAHVSLTTEVDMSYVIEMKNRIGSKVLSKYGVKLSINDIVVKCVAEALKEYPRINSVFTDTEIVEKEEINVGMAVALDEGLMVPVIRNVDKLGLGEIALKSKDLAERARKGKLLPDDYNGGTFTVSNLGMYEITQFTSIINQPESAILSVSKSVERAVVIDGQIAIRPMMNVTISFDHRPIDGSTAAVFLRRVKQLLEEPYELVV